MKKRISRIKLKDKITSLLRKIGFNINEINAIIRSWEYASLSENTPMVLIELFG